MSSIITALPAVALGCTIIMMIPGYTQTASRPDISCSSANNGGRWCVQRRQRMPLGYCRLHPTSCTARRAGRVERVVGEGKGEAWVSRYDPGLAVAAVTQSQPE